MTKQDYNATFKTAQVAVVAWKANLTPETEATMDEANEVYMAADVLYYAELEASAIRPLEIVLQGELLEALEASTIKRDPHRQVTVRRAIAMFQAEVGA